LIIERENEISAFIATEYWTAETMAKIMSSKQELPLTLRSISGKEEFQEEAKEEKETQESKGEKGGKFSPEVMQYALSRL
jgi:DNA topoisomerase IA